MPLHNSKRIAILQWYNSLSSQALQNIEQLADGKFLCDILKSTFHQPSTLDSVIENTSVEDATGGSKDINTLQCATTSADSITPIKPSADETAGQSTSDVAAEIQMKDKQTNFCSSTISERYIILQKFISDTYGISEDVISYEECMNSNELELGKIAIFILSAVVEHHVKTKSAKNDLLTLLDVKVQEDIQECLSAVLMNDHVITSKYLQKILSKQAKYKTSHRNSSAFATPQRNCSSKYKSPSTETVTDEIYTNSPLKSFMESPLFQRHMESKEKELKRTRKTLISEEIRSETLQCEINELKKQIESKDEEIKRFKMECKKCYDELDIANQSCDNLKNELELSKKREKMLQEDLKQQKTMMDEEVSKYNSIIADLHEQVQSEKQDYPKNLEALERLCRQKCQIIELEIERRNELEAQIKQLKDDHFALKEVYEQKLVEARTFMKPLESPMAEKTFGECIGNVIEEENRRLQLKLNRALQKIAELKSKLGEETSLVESKNSNCSTISTDVSESEVLRVSPSNTRRQRSLTNFRRENSVSSACSSSSYVNDDFTSEREREKVNESSVLPIPDGALWSNYNDSITENSFSTFLPNGIQVPSHVNKNICSESVDPALSHFKDSVTYCKTAIVEKDDLKRAGHTYHENKSIQALNDNAYSVLDNNFNFQKDNSINVANIIPPNNSNSLDLYKPLGINKSELTSKIKYIKKIIASLKDVFPKKGDNGFIGAHLLENWNKRFKSDDDYILCFFFIAESLLNFLNSHQDCLNNKKLNNSSSNGVNTKNFEKANKDILYTCNDFVTEKYKALNQKIDDLNSKIICDGNVIDKLKKENNKLKENINVLEMKRLTDKEEAISNCDELRNKLMNLENQYQDLLSSHEALKAKYEHYYQKYVSLKTIRDQLTTKTKELARFRREYGKLEQNYKNMYSAIHSLQDENLEFENKNKQLVQLLQKEKQAKQDMYIEYKGYKESSMIEIQKLEKALAYFIADIKEKNNEKLETNTLNVKENHGNIQKPELVVKKFNVELEIKGKPGCSSESEFILPDAPANVNEAISDKSKEKTMSSALINQSIRSGFLQNDDEEHFMNHSSIAEIKKEDPDDRIQELHRRNTMCLPHLQSSYPVELQSFSPFNSTTFELLYKRAMEKDVCAVSDKVKSKEPSRKKRKIYESTGNDMDTTPKRKFPTVFRTPSSLQRLLKIRKGLKQNVKPR